MSLTRAVCAAIVATSVATAAVHAADYPFPMIGQEITHKSFANAAGPMQIPAHPPADPQLVPVFGPYGWVNTTFPADPAFHKFFRDTTLRCTGAYDFVPAPDDTINVALTVSGVADSYIGRWGSQNVTGTSDSRGHLITIGEPTFDFHGVPPGDLLINVLVASMSEKAFNFHAQVANMQCLEIAEPPDQTKPPFRAPQE